MLNKRLCFLLLIALLVASILGCDTQIAQTSESTSQTQATTANICPPTVIIEGKEYRDWSILRSNISIEEDHILGHITSTVSRDTMPKQNNEANYPSAQDAPYALWTDEEYGQVYVIWHGRGWYILLPADYLVSE